MEKIELLEDKVQYNIIIVVLYPSNLIYMFCERKRAHWLSSLFLLYQALRKSIGVKFSSAKQLSVSHLSFYLNPKEQLMYSDMPESERRVSLTY